MNNENVWGENLVCFPQNFPPFFKDVSFLFSSCSCLSQAAVLRHGTEKNKSAIEFLTSLLSKNAYKILIQLSHKWCHTFFECVWV